MVKCYTSRGPRVLRLCWSLWKRPGELSGSTAWSLHTSATVGGFGEPRRSTPAALPASAGAAACKPRPLFINASSWAAAMSCQAALGPSALYSTHTQVPEETHRLTSHPWVAKRSGPHTRPHIHLKNSLLHSLTHPEGVKLERPFNPDMNHGNAVCPQPWLPSLWN